MNSTSDRTRQDDAEASYYRSAANNAVAKPIPKWLFPSIFLGGLVAFLAIVGQAEVSRWHEASAMNALEDRRFDDAIRSATKGLKWDPNSTGLIAVRSRARLELKDFDGALADQDLIIELAAKENKFSPKVIAAKSEKASLLQRMSRYEASIELWNEVVDYHEHQYKLRNDTVSLMAFTQALNNKAYIQAQAHVDGIENIDIEAALADVNKAIELRGLQEPFMIDTQGYLKLLNGDAEGAHYLLDNAVRLTEETSSKVEAQLKRQMRNATDQRPYEDALRGLNEQLAVIVHHRGEALNALGEEEKGQADIDRAVKLGYSREDGIW